MRISAYYSKISAGRRAVIRAFPGPLSSPGMTYWMVACTVYLFIVTLGKNVRFCRADRVERRAPGRTLAVSCAPVPS